jgi:hypothetical protein
MPEAIPGFSEEAISTKKREIVNRRMSIFSDRVRSLQPVFPLHFFIAPHPLLQDNAS